MATLVARRLGSALVIALVLVAIVFILRSVTPVNPVRALLGPNAAQGAIDEATQRLGLDRPLPEQYVRYVANVLHGDFGFSLRTRRPVTTDLQQFLPATIELAGFSLLLALSLGFLFALSAAGAWRQSTALRMLLVAGASAPGFLLGLLGLLLFFRYLRWLPATGRTAFFDAPTGPTGLLTVDSLIAGRLDVTLDALSHLVLPSAAIAIGPAVAIGRVLRSSLHSTLRTNYVRTARAKGLREGRVLWSHALRNSIGPAISMAGLQLGMMFAGIVIIEQIFAWPGIGSYVAGAIPANDYPAIAAVTIILGLAYVFINALVDVLQAVADPRIRL